MDSTTEIELQLRNDVIKLTLTFVARISFVGLSVVGGLLRVTRRSSSSSETIPTIFSRRFQREARFALSTGCGKQTAVIRDGNAGAVFTAFNIARSDR